MTRIPRFGALLFPIVLCLSLLGACAGVEIEPLTAAQAQEVHHGGAQAAGYVVYAPMVVLEVAQEEVCIAKDDKGHCQAQETRCTASKPFTLPDYSKPYRVSSKSGLASAGSEINITDGWMLGSVKISVDNAPALGLVQKLVALNRLETPDAGTSGRGCSAAGLYKADMVSGAVKLSPLLLY